MILDCMLGDDFGGLEKVFLDQLSMLPAAGMPVRGIARRGSPAAKRAKALGLPCDEITVVSDLDPVTRSAARAIVRKHDPKLVLCHGRKAHRVFARATGDAPVVAMVHKPRFDIDLPYAGVIVVAEHRKRTLVADGVPDEKIAVVPNAVVLPPEHKRNYDIASSAKIAGLGRLHEKKGFGVLIEALKLLDDQRVDFTCTIAGEGSLRAALEESITRNGLGNRVSLPGWTENPVEFLTGADIFTFPSTLEDFPLALLDAMAAGVPIVSSDIDGPRDFLVEGESALLVPPEDAKALASALTHLVSDAGLRKRLGTNARRMAEERYSFEATGKRLAAVLRNVIGGRPIGEGL